MADTVKKAKAPAKPRATAAKKKVAEPAAAAPEHVKAPSHHEIADLARHFWAERGYKDGHAEQDWIRAEQELLKKAS